MRKVRARCPAPLLLLGAGGCLLLAPAALGASSQYPASATRPALQISSSELAYQARKSRSKHSQHPKKRSARRRKKRHKPALPLDAVRALAAYEEMEKQYSVQGSGGLYRGEPFAYLWPFSQALAATVSVANIRGIPDPGPGVSFAQEIRERLRGLSSYLDTNNSHQPDGTFTSTLAAYDGEVAPPAGPGGPKYYDDNDWVGIELVRLYKQTHRSSLLGSAEGIMAFEMAAWETGPHLACPGGIPFSNEVVNDTRNTVTNAPTAELGVELYQLTGDAQYLAFAEMAYEWVRGCLLQPSGLYADHISARGTVNASLWSYNQGTMIGAGTLLYQATGDGAYLWQARQTARAALSYFTLKRLDRELPFFVSVYLRDVLYLDSVTHDPPGRKLARVYVNHAWRNWRLGNNLLVWGSPPSAQLLVQAAIVQIYALLSSPPSTYF